MLVIAKTMNTDALKKYSKKLRMANLLNESMLKVRGSPLQCLKKTYFHRKRVRANDKTSHLILKTVEP